MLGLMVAGEGERMIMDFSLDREEEMVREMVREFAEREIAPIAAEMDEKGRIPEELVKKMSRYNFWGIPIPQEYGGAGASYLSYIIAMEELARVCAALEVACETHTSLCAEPIYHYGTEEQKRKYLAPLARGETIGGFALTEPNAGSDAGALETTAVLDGDTWVLNGTKIFITNALLADIFVVMAKTDRSQGIKGISAFLVEKGTPGFAVGLPEKTLGIRASAVAELVFDDCRIPRENILGKPGEGFRLAMASLDGGRIGIAAQAVGIAQAAHEAAVKYARERKQFGRSIGRFQAIQWMIADMATEIQAARLLTYQAAYRRGRGLNHTKEAAMAKLYASEMAMRHTVKALQVHGGYGYMTDYPVERYLRDAKITEIYEGTSEVQRMVIAGNILR